MQVFKHPWRLVAVLVGLAILIAAAARGYLWISSPEYRFNLGLDALARLDLDDARQHAVRLDRAGNALHAAALKGAIALRSGKLEEALTTLGQIRDESDLMGLVNTWGGEALLAMDQPLVAAHAFGRALQADPDQPDARRLMAGLQYDMGEHEKALAELKQAAELAPRNPGPCSLLGHMLQERGEHAQAVEWYVESLRRGPQQPDRDVVCLEYAESLFHLKQFDAARAMLANCPPSVKSLGLTAECFREEGRRKEAHAVIDQLLQGEPPHDLTPLLFKGGLAIDDQDGETAVRVLSEAVSQQPKLEQARAMLATAYRLAGQLDQAAAEEAAAARLREQWSQLQALNAKVEAEPENVAALVDAGVAARELDMLDVAAQYFSAALRIDPENAAAKAGLAGIPGASPAPADESDAAPTDEATVPPPDESTVPPADEVSPAPADEGPATESPPGGEPTVDAPPEDGGM